MAAVEALRSGVTPEDDFTECKARWPEKATARQLAGLCNRAAGEAVVYIIGVHDRTGEVMNPGEVDPADWWAGMRGQFDQVPPDLIIHQAVFLGDGKAVHAFVFDSSRAPYVVKTKTSALDVPIRDGTSTRSAHRHELLRLLLPATATPEVVLLGSRLAGYFREPAEDRAQGSSIAPKLRRDGGSVDGMMRCFVERLPSNYVMLPNHGMRGSVTCGDWQGHLSVKPSYFMRNKDAPSAFGATVEADGIVVTGPASFAVDVQGPLPLPQVESVASASDMGLTVELDVAGGNRPLRLQAQLTRVPPMRWDGQTSGLRNLGRFAFQGRYDL